MVRWRIVDGATRDTNQIKEADVGVNEQPEDQRREELYPEPDLDNRHPHSSWRSRSNCWKTRNTWENSIQDPAWRQGDGGCRGSNVRNSTRMKCSPRSDNGRQRRDDDHGNRYQAEERWSTTRMEERAEGRKYLPEETQTLTQGILEKTKPSRTLFRGLEWNSTRRRWMADTR